MNDKRIEKQDQAFMQVLANRTMLKVYIMSIVHDPHLAEDVLSEVTLVVVKKWETFDQSRDFGPWVRAIAKRLALATLRRNNKNIVTLDSDVLETFGEDLSSLAQEGEQDEIKQKLRNCLKKLPENNFKLIKMRYFDKVAYSEISDLTGRSKEALYMAFSRIHRILAQCVKG